MFSLNRAQIIGNLTRDPEMRYTPSGQAVVSFGVATNRRWTTAAGETQEDTQFHNIVAWRKLAEICHQILRKGNRVYVEGRLQTRQWDAPDGSKRQRTEVVMENFVALTPKAGGSVPIAEPTAAEEAITPPTEPKKQEGKQRDTKGHKGEKAKKEETGEEDINLDEIPF